MGIIERAYELARTGQFATRSKISRAMEKERYSLAELVAIQGAAITKDLNRICKEAQAVRVASRQDPAGELTVSGEHKSWS